MNCKQLTVVNKENSPIRMHPLLPSLRQRPQVVVGSLVDHRSRGLVRHGASPTRPGVHPRRCPLIVINEEQPAIGSSLDAPTGR